MLGNDAFMNPMTVGIGSVPHAPITDAERRMILGLNLAHLLNAAGMQISLLNRPRATQLEKTEVFQVRHGRCCLYHFSLHAKGVFALIRRAGFPAMTESGSTFLTTTAPVPIML